MLEHELLVAVARWLLQGLHRCLQWILELVDYLQIVFDALMVDLVLMHLDLDLAVHVML